MARSFVGIGEIKTVKDTGDKLQVMALGSCVAVIFYSPADGRIAIAHVALPDSSRYNGSAEKKPGYYADTAVSNLVRLFAVKNNLKNSDVVINLVGGAAIMDPNGTFDIGKRNVLAIRKALWHHRLSTNREDVGGDYSRTVKAEPVSGKIVISSPGKGNWQL